MTENDGGRSRRNFYTFQFSALMWKTSVNLLEAGLTDVQIRCALLWFRSASVGRLTFQLSIIWTAGSTAQSCFKVCFPDSENGCSRAQDGSILSRHFLLTLSDDALNLESVQGIPGNVWKKEQIGRQKKENGCQKGESGRQKP